MALGPKRPRDANQRAKLLVDIATGAIVDELGKSKKTGTAKGRAGGRKGGPARSRSLSPEQRADIARIAAEARWKKSRG